MIFAVSPCPLEYQQISSIGGVCVAWDPFWGHCRLSDLAFPEVASFSIICGCPSLKAKDPEFSAYQSLVFYQLPSERKKTTENARETNSGVEKLTQSSLKGLSNRALKNGRFASRFLLLGIGFLEASNKANLSFKSPSPKPHLNRTGSAFALPTNTASLPRENAHRSNSACFERLKRVGAWSLEALLIKLLHSLLQKISFKSSKCWKSPAKIQQCAY